MANDWDVIGQEPAAPMPRKAQAAIAADDPWAVEEVEPSFADFMRNPIGVAGNEIARQLSRTAPSSDIDRTWTEALVTDPATRLRQGARNVVGGLLGAPVEAMNLGAAITNPVEAVRRIAGGDPMVQQPDFVRGMQGVLEDQNQQDIAANLSEKGLAQMGELQAQDGFVDTLGYLATNPSALASEGIAQIPQFLQIIRGSKWGTIALQSLAAGAQNGAQIYQTLIDEGADPAEADRVAQAASNIITIGSGALTALPGASSFERVLAGGAGREGGETASRAMLSLLGEPVSEALQEGGVEQVAQNIATGRPWSEGTGQAAALGAAIGAPGGALAAGADLLAGSPAGAMSGEWTPIAQEQITNGGESREQSTPDGNAALDAQQRDFGAVLAGEAVAGDAGGLGSSQGNATAAGSADNLRPAGPESSGQVGTDAPAGPGSAPNGGRIAGVPDAGGAAPVDGATADGEAGAQTVQGELPPQSRRTVVTADEIVDFPGLSDEQRAVESRARDQVVSDPEKALRDYAEVPGTDGGRIVSTDEAREVFGEYNSGPDARSKNAVSVHEPASWIANETFRRRMAQPVEQGKEPVVFFTGGGTGAGKSTGPKRIDELGRVFKDADTIFDGNLQSAPSAIRKIDLALNSGRDVHILYTFRDPVQSFLYGALPRAERQDYGRTVPTVAHAGTHVGAAKTFFALREHYAGNPNVKIEAVWNDFEPGVSSSISAASDAEIRALAETNSDQLKQELDDALEDFNQQGRVSPRVYHGTRGEPVPEQRRSEPVRAQAEAADAGRGERARRQDQGRQQEVEAARAAATKIAKDVDVVDSMADIPADVRSRVGLTEADDDVEGFFDEETGKAYVIYDNLRPERAQSRQARAAWVAAHETAGHRGIRALLGDRLSTVLRRARNNDTVKAIVASMSDPNSRGYRPETGDILIEEALVELAAAVRTGDYSEIRNRYGVEFTPDQRSNVRALIERMLAAIRDALGGEGFSDAQLYQLIEDAGRANERAQSDSATRGRRGGSGRTIASRVGTRNPSAVKATESGVDPDTQVGYDSFKADNKSFEKNVGLISKYTGIRKVRGKATADRVAEAFVTHARDNILALYDAAPKVVRERARKWYEGANKAANEIAKRYGVTDVQAAAAIAALSPQKDWYQNLSLAERIIDATTNQSDRQWDGEMSSTLNRIFGADQYAALRDAVEGKALSDLSDPVERAAWIRTYDQTHNDPSFPITSPEGEIIGTYTTATGNPASIQWGSLAEAAKAVSVLEDGGLENVSALLGNAHKIRSFYNNIIDPASEDGDVTIDTHAVAAALIRPLSAATTEVLHAFGNGTSNSSITGNKGTYGLYAEAYRRAAADRGIKAREIQSIVWEAVRTLFPGPARRPKSAVKAKVESIWDRYAKREINHDQATEEAINAGGGVREPDWARPAAAVDEGEWRGAFRPKVSGAGVPGRGAKPIASRRGNSRGVERGVHPDAAVTLNVGLSTAELRGGGELTANEVIDTIESTGARVLSSSRHISDSEPTLVIDLDRPLTEAEGDRVSEELDQQAIVQRAVDGSGELFGPMRDEWGPYNPAYFVMPDGERAGPVASRRTRNPQIDTPEFKRWFGDSKVVDQNGEPLVVYHGTNESFDEFDINGANELGSWFTAPAEGHVDDMQLEEARGAADNFAYTQVDLYGGNETVMPVYLSIQNPMEFDSYSAFEEWSEQSADGAALRARLQGEGYDGVVIRNSDTDSGEVRDDWVAFSPTQIKSATGNRGTFDPSDPSIIASRRRRTATGRRGRTALAFSAKPRQPDAVSADAYHYSNTPGLTELDPTFAGTAGAGRERRAFGMGRFGERGGTYARLNFYVREPGAPVPGVEDVVRGAGGSNLYRVQLDNMYDLDNDPRGFAEEAGMNQDMLEEEISDAGFDGFLAGPQPGIDTPVAVVFDIDGTIPVEPVRPVASRRPVNRSFTTGVDSATTRGERFAAGRDPIVDEAAKTNKSTIDDARKALAEDPDAGAATIIKLTSAGVDGITLADEAILLVHKADLMNRRIDAERKLSDGRTSEATKEAARQTWMEIEGEIAMLDAAALNAGREWGRFGQFRQRQLREDYSLAALEQKERARLERPLTPAESATIKAMAEKIADQQKRVDELQERIKNAESEWAFDVMTKALPRRRSSKDRIAGLRKAADEARARLKATPGVPSSRRQSGAVLSPAVLADYAVIGAYHIANGAATLADWVADMTEELGDAFTRFKADHPRIFKAAADHLAAMPADRFSRSPEEVLAGIDTDNVKPQDVRNLVAAYVGDGVRTEPEVIGRVASDIGATPEETRALFVQSTPRAERSLTEAEQELRDLRKIIRIEAEIDRLEAGREKAPPRQRKADSEQVAEKKRELLELRRRLRPVFDAEGRYQAMRGRAIQKRIDEIRTRIANEDFAPRVRVPRRLSKANEQAQFELAKAKEEFLRHQFEDNMRKRSPLAKIFGAVGDTFNLARAILTSFDLSGLLRQGGFISFGHPVAGGRAFAKSLRAFLSDENEHAIRTELESRPNAHLYKKFGLQLTGIGSGPLTQIEEAYASRWLSKLPTWTGAGLVRGSGRAYVSLLNRLRADSFDAMAAALARKGELTDAEGKAIAGYVNAATGRGKLGSGKISAGEDAAQFLNTVFFAPRLVASRFQLLIGQPLYGGTARTRRLIAQDYARFAIGVGVTMSLLTLAADDDDDKPVFEFDPRSSNFLKVRFGNTYVDAMTGLSQVSVFLARLASGESKAQDGSIKPLRSGLTLTDLRIALGAEVEPHEVGDDGSLPFGSRNAAEVIGSFMRTKLAPVPGAIVTALSGENVIGEVMSPAEVATEMVIPMSLQDIAGMMRDNGVTEGTALALMGILGMGVQHRDISNERALADFNNKIKADQDELKARLMELPLSEWQAAFDDAKDDYGLSMQGVELAIYKSDGKYGKKGEPQRTSEGRPRFKSNRLSDRDKYSSEWTREGYQVHHIIPDNLVRHHPLMDRARELGYDLDNSSNLIEMSGRKGGGEDGSVGHRTSHPKYDAEVFAALQDAEERLRREHGSIDNAPRKEVLDAVHKIEDEMRERIENRDVPVKDGRLASIQRGGSTRA